MPCARLSEHRSAPRGDRGAVLAVVVLMAVALLSLGHGLVVSSRSALTEARLSSLHAGLQAAADGAVVHAVEAGGGVWMDSVTVGSRGGRTASADGSDSTASVWRRLSPEAWLVEGAAWRGGRSPVESSRIVWVLDAVERMRSLEAVIGTAPAAVVTVRGSVSGDALLETRPPLDAASCLTWDSQLSQIFATGTAPSVGAIDTLTLGRLDVAHLLADASHRVEGSGTPMPEESGGRCLTDSSWNWGDPDRPYRSCSAHLPLIGSESDLIVDGGSGQGVLVVDGDLTLRGDTRFHGLVLTTGVLRLLDTSRLEGFALTYGGLEIDAGGEVVGSACWAVRALAAQRTVLNHSISLHPARRIGSFR